MNRLGYLAVEASAAVLFFPLYYFLNRRYIRNARKSILFCLLSCYLAALYALTGLPNITYTCFEPNLNLIPFAGMLRDLKNSILNVCMFVPLGIFLPILVKNCRSLPGTLSRSLFVSLFIEGMQVFSGRATDVNDILTNALGAVIGFVIIKRIPGFYLRLPSSRKEMALVFAISFLLMFFLQPIFTNLIWLLL